MKTAPLLLYVSVFHHPLEHKMNVIVFFRFTAADESRLLVVLQFIFSFAERFSYEKRTLLFMLILIITV